MDVYVNTTLKNIHQEFVPHIKAVYYTFMKWTKMDLLVRKYTYI